MLIRLYKERSIWISAILWLRIGRGVKWKLRSSPGNWGLFAIFFSGPFLFVPGFRKFRSGQTPKTNLSALIWRDWWRTETRAKVAQKRVETKRNRAIGFPLVIFTPKFPLSFFPISKTVDSAWILPFPWRACLPKRTLEWGPAKAGH